MRATLTFFLCAREGTREARARRCSAPPSAPVSLPSVGLILVVMSFAGFVALGMGDSVLGVAWPSVADDFGRDVSQLGALLAVGIGAYAVASAATGAVSRRIGLGRMLVVSAGVMAVGFAGYSAAGGWAIVLVSQAAIGAGGALIDAGLNAYGALRFDERAMNLLHAAFGVGAAAGPAMMTAVITSGAGWRAGYLALTLIQVVLVAGFLLTRRRWDTASALHTGHVAPGSGSRRAAVLGIGVFAVYTGLEVAAGQWSFTLLTQGRGVGEVAAGLWVTGYWLSLTVGRLGAAAAGRRVPALHSLRWGTVTALAGTIVFWWAPSETVAAVGLMAVGFGLAPVFPALVLLTPGRVGSERTAGAVGMQLAAAALGAAVLPGGIGLLVDRAGLGSIGPALVVGATVLASGALGMHRGTELIGRNGSAAGA